MLIKWIIAAALLIITIHSGSSTEPRIVCYYKNWSIYRSGKPKFTPEQIDPNLCTHLVYAFSIFSKNSFELTPSNEYADVDQLGYHEFNALKKLNPNLKTLVSIDAAKDESQTFSVIASSAHNRRGFINSTIRFLRNNGFDGLDINWQYPSVYPTYRKENFVKLTKELKEAMIQEVEHSKRPVLLLSMSIPSNVNLIDKGFDIRNLNRYVDWFNVLAYKYEPYSYDVEIHTESPVQILNFDNTINYLINLGAERTKLVLGIPTFGRSYTLTKPSFGAKVQGPGLNIGATDEIGHPPFFEICKIITDNDSKKNYEKWTVVESNKDIGPYAFKKNQWMSYEDQNIVTKKAQYVAMRKLGGVMFWTINDDDFNGNCYNKTFPIIRAAKTAFVHLGVIKRRTLNKRSEDSLSTTTAIGEIVPKIEQRIKGLTDSYLNVLEDYPTPQLTFPYNDLGRRIVCYFESWVVYRIGAAKFTPNHIDPFLCTHIVYAFGKIADNSTLHPLDVEADFLMGGYENFTNLKNKNPFLKTMLSVGGSNADSGKISFLAETFERRRAFANDAIQYLRRYNFDGLDLDWLYPGDSGRSQDKRNYPLLVRELRESMEREAFSSGLPRLLLSMAVPAPTQRIDMGYDIPKLNRYVDWMNVLSFDYYTVLETSVNHHTPLFPIEGVSDTPNLSVDTTINYYLRLGADREKLILGIPVYGRSYTLLDPDDKDIGAPVDGPGVKGEATRESGVLSYYEICDKLVNNTDVDKWTVVHFNPEAMGPYAYQGNQWVAYDDSEMVTKKVEYVTKNKLGGVMFWSINKDDFHGLCYNKRFPVISAAKEALDRLLPHPTDLEEKFLRMDTDPTSDVDQEVRVTEPLITFEENKTESPIPITTMSIKKSEVIGTQEEQKNKEDTTQTSIEPQEKENSKMIKDLLSFFNELGRLKEIKELINSKDPVKNEETALPKIIPSPFGQKFISKTKERKYTKITKKNPTTNDEITIETNKSIEKEETRYNIQSNADDTPSRNPDKDSLDEVLDV